MGSKDTSAAKSLLVPGAAQVIWKGCGSDPLRDKPTLCPVCGAHYHASCADKYQGGLNGGFRRCCGSRTPSPSPLDGQVASSASNAAKPVTLQDLHSVLAGCFKKSNSKFDGIAHRMDLIANKQQTVETSTAAINNRMDRVENRMEATETRMDNVESGMIVIQSDLAELGHSGLSDEEILREAEDRNRRATNLIFFNVPQAPDQGHQQIITTFESLNIATAAVRCMRIGSTPPADAHRGPRPVCVTFGSREEAQHVFKNRATLKLNGQPVKIKFDHTKKQREQLSAARALLDEKKKSGDNEGTIQYQNNVPRVVKKSVMLKKD